MISNNHPISEIFNLVDRKQLSIIVLDTYSDSYGKSQIMTNAFRLHAEDLAMQISEEKEGENLVLLLSYLERAIKITPVNAQTELKQMIYEKCV